MQIGCLDQMLLDLSYKGEKMEYTESINMILIWWKIVLVIAIIKGIFGIVKTLARESWEVVEEKETKTQENLEEDLKKYKFLQDPMKIEMTVFILFFIPGTPKDALIYLAPLIPISPIKFFLIATFARINKSHL